VFNTTGNERNAFILRICKSIAAYNICELSNVDVMYNHVKERYNACVNTLEKIAGMGEYAKSPMFISGLPSPAGTDQGETGGESGAESSAAKPFRAGSRTKFNHE
jgi:hypothetical protein